MKTPKKGLLIAGHGSRDEKAITEFKNFVSDVACQLPNHTTDSGFLEFAKPTLDESLKTLIDQGITTITIMPLMLMAAGHVKNDIPSEINHFQHHHPHIKLRYGKPIDIQAHALQGAQQIIKATHQKSQSIIPLKDTLLLVIGRGANDADANSNINKITRLLWEGLKVGWAETAFSGSVYPLTQDALTHLHPMGFQQIIVLPYLLFCGRLMDRILQSCDNYQQAHPNVKLIKTPYLNNHPLIIKSFIKRLEEVENGHGNMNCQLCHYREKIIGHEQKKGQPQAGHHHHVRGIGTDHTH